MEDMRAEGRLPTRWSRTAKRSDLGLSEREKEACSALLAFWAQWNKEITHNKYTEMEPITGNVPNSPNQLASTTELAEPSLPMKDVDITHPLIKQASPKQDSICICRILQQVNSKMDPKKRQAIESDCFLSGSCSLWSNNQQELSHCSM
eukprot:Filipodium_phascolosomae@DN7462_c0_g1_i1.p1